MDKPLKDWTLEEAQARCKRQSGNCFYCVFSTSLGKCRITYSTPEKWDLSEPPLFAKEEYDQMEAIRIVFPDRPWVARDQDGDLCVYSSRPEKKFSLWSSDMILHYISETLLPSIKWTDLEPINIQDELKKAGRI